MESVHHVRPAGQDYYLRDVARTPEDYYLGAGEAPGQWIGSAADSLGLAGQVDGDAFARLLDGRHPGTGRRLVADRPDRVGGFDLTFSAPKSVSLLWALHPDPEVRRQVAEAHRAAVADSVAYVEARGLWARRGHNGTERVAVTGMAAAAFEQRTSREGDPQLHTHVVVANMVADHAGRWSAPDGRGFYRHARAGGFVYQARLRHELVTRLGVEWGPVRTGQADLAGIRRTAIDRFSTRRAQIVSALDQRGLSSMQAARVATLDTRRPKDVTLDPGGLAAGWSEVADELGLDVTGLVGPARQPALADPDRLAGQLAGPDGLTSHRASFERRHAICAAADLLPEGATLAELEGRVDRVLGDDRVVRLGPADGPGASPGYTTVDLLAKETALEAQATRPAAHRHPYGVATPEAIERALADRPTLSEEQARVVFGICDTNAPIVTVVGKAGAGKTFTLDAARAAWTDSGVPVLGAALAARAAAELQSGSGIPSTTLARLIGDIERPEGRLLPGTAIVIDEAGMIGTRQLHHLAGLAEAQGAKLVLVGDPAQLPEIHAGGAFARLVGRTPGWELSTNRRQREGWERETLDMLREQKPAPALQRYGQEGRITIADTAPEVRARMAADWHQAHAAGEEVVMLAVRRADVADLNQRAQTELIAAGTLDPDGPSADLGDGQTALIGDQVLCGRNDRHLGLLNGTRLTVTAIDPDTREITGRHPDGYQVIVPGSYVADGDLALGYASTIHKAQGRTVDKAFLLGDDRLFAEAGYVGLSRGRDRNQLYIVADHHTRDLPGPGHGLVDHVCDALGVSRAQHLSTAEVAGPLPQGTMGQLVAERDRLCRQLLTGLPQDAGQRDLWAAEHREDGERLARVTAAADRRSERLGQAALADPPDYLTSLLGPVPDRPRDRDAWADAASAVATWQEISGRNPDRPSALLLEEPSGTDPTHGWWRSAAHQLDTYQTRLAHDPDHHVVVDRGWQLARTQEQGLSL